MQNQDYDKDEFILKMKRLSGLENKEVLKENINTDSKKLLFHVKGADNKRYAIIQENNAYFIKVGLIILVAKLIN